MLEIKYVRKNLSIIQEALKNRHDKADLDTFITIEAKRRDILLTLEELQRKRNTVSEQVAALKKKGENAETLIIEMRDVSTTIKDLEKQLAENEEAVNLILYTLPNIPHASVPIGNDENDNPVMRRIGEPPAFEF